MNRGVRISVVTPSQQAIEERRHRPGSVVSLAVLLVLVAVGSLQGGIAMVLDPIAPLGMSTDFLERAPVDDYYLPGLFLIGIALASLLAAAGMLFSWRWKWADAAEHRIGYRWPWVAAVSVGGLLLAFEIIELLLIPFHPIMHPLLIAASLAILGLASTRSARRHLSTN